MPSFCVTKWYITNDSWNEENIVHVSIHSHFIHGTASYMETLLRNYQQWETDYKSSNLHVELNEADKRNKVPREVLYISMVLFGSQSSEPTIWLLENDLFTACDGSF